MLKVLLTPSTEIAALFITTSPSMLLLNCLCSRELKVKKAKLTGDAGNAVLSLELEMKELKKLD